jgi:hypothetical protein
VDEDQEFEDLTPQTPQGDPVQGEPADPPLEDAQAAVDAVMESLDQELPEPNTEAPEASEQPPEQTFDGIEIPAIDELDAIGEDDPFRPPVEELEDLLHELPDVEVPQGTDSSEPPAQAEGVQPAQPQGPRGFSFPGLPPTPTGQGAETLADDGFFTQKMEQEGAGRDAQSEMFRAESRSHGLATEAMIEYARHLDLLSDRYERDRL